MIPAPCFSQSSWKSLLFIIIYAESSAATAQGLDAGKFSFYVEIGDLDVRTTVNIRGRTIYDKKPANCRWSMPILIAVKEVEYPWQRNVPCGVMIAAGHNVEWQTRFLSLIRQLTFKSKINFVFPF